MDINTNNSVLPLIIGDIAAVIAGIKGILRVDFNSNRLVVAPYVMNFRTRTCPVIAMMHPVHHDEECECSVCTPECTGCGAPLSRGRRRCYECQELGVG